MAMMRGQNCIQDKRAISSSAVRSYTNCNRDENEGGRANGSNNNNINKKPMASVWMSTPARTQPFLFTGGTSTVFFPSLFPVSALVRIDFVSI